VLFLAGRGRRRGFGMGEDARWRRGKRGGWYGVLTGCGGRPAAGRVRGGGSARSVRDRGGGETPTGVAPTTGTDGDGFVWFGFKI
jgi:hypothetical protein